MGREELKWHQLAHHHSANEPAKDIILVHTIQIKPMVEAQISGRMVSSGISDVAFTLVYSEKNRLKKLLINEKRRCRDG